MLDPINVETTVNSSPEQTFDAFVLRINDWWPMQPYSMSQGTLHMDPKLCGLIEETSASGETFVWGHVTAWDRPARLELAWYVGATVETATQIEVTFDDAGEGKTLVALVQTGWEALGNAAAEIRTRNDGGWRTILGTHFADFIHAEKTR